MHNAKINVFINYINLSIKFLRNKQRVLDLPRKLLLEYQVRNGYT